MTRKPGTYLGLDLGASSGRAVVGTVSQGRLALRQVHRFANAPVEMGGTLYWDLPRLWGEAREALRQCGQRGINRLDGIGIDTWGVDFGLLGPDGRLNGSPLCYRDKITAGAVERLHAVLSPERLYALTGMSASRVGTLAQLVGLRGEAGGARLRHAETLLMMPGLFRYFLCGHRGVERTMAGSTLLTNVRTGRWCGTLLKALDLPARILPPIVPPATLVGRLDTALAGEAGLDQVPIIAVAGHDTLAAAAAAPFADEGTAFISMGTWAVVGVIRQQPITTADALRRGFVNELGLDSVLFARNLSGLYLFENLRRALARRGVKVSYAAMVTAAAAARPFACRLDINAPEFFVTDDPMDSTRTYLERTGQQRLSAWPAVARGLLEGLTWSLRQALRDLAELTGQSLQRISMVGGGTRNRLLCQWVADATGLELLAGPAEATAAGNVAVQALATGRVDESNEIRDLVRSSFSLRRYHPRCGPDWDRHEPVSQA